jgi:hypothetical protein
MRTSFGKRWALIGFLAAGLVALTVPSASAAVWYNATPPDGSLIFGPGCRPDYGEATVGAGAHWNVIDTGGYNGGICGPTTVYTLTQATQTATFHWALYAGFARTQNCQVYAYIPSAYAGDYDTRYDFWAASDNGDYSWLGWPGATVNQDPHQGWTHIGGVIVPAGAPTSTSPSATPRHIPTGGWEPEPWPSTAPPA